MDRVFASFRDPSGYVRLDGSRVLRTVNEVYAPHFRQLVESGLAEELWQAGQLIRFQDEPSRLDASAWKVLSSERLPFIALPYEWCFGQLKQAALLTLDVHLAALRRGMVLKDASAFNVAFRGPDPVLIDCLSFEKHEDGRPWQAYRQFCSHFLAPLLLMAGTDPRLQRMSQLWIDGVPLDLASRLASWRTYLRPGALMHLHVHAWMQGRHSDNRVEAARARDVKVTGTQLSGIAESLRATVLSLHLRKERTTWGAYYGDCSYDAPMAEAKLRFVERVAASVTPKVAVDLGANDGRYSRAIAPFSGQVVSADFDTAAVEANFRLARESSAANVMSMVLDLANPTPALGWSHRERQSFVERGPYDLVLALALVHHLAITANIPLPMIAAFFAEITPNLVIEFVPPEDPQTQRIAARLPEALARYSEAAFTEAFAAHYVTVDMVPLPNSNRTLHHMRARHG